MAPLRLAFQQELSNFETEWAHILHEEVLWSHHSLDEVLPEQLQTIGHIISKHRE